MDAASIWAGEHYAWMPDRGRYQNVETFTAQVKRVKVHGLRKAYRYGNDRRTTMVRFEVLDWDGGEFAEQRIQEEPARQLVETWSEYFSMHEEKFEKHLERKREEARKEQERHDHEMMFRKKLQALGLDLDNVKFDRYSKTISINLDELRRWLNLITVHNVNS